MHPVHDVRPHLPPGDPSAGGTDDSPEQGFLLVKTCSEDSAGLRRSNRIPAGRDPKALLLLRNTDDFAARIEPAVGIHPAKSSVPPADYHTSHWPLTRTRRIGCTVASSPETRFFRMKE